MDEVKLDGADERVRRECEQRARQYWPGARVLVHREQGRYRAAVFLAEDRVEPGASAERSAPAHSPGAALAEVRDALARQKTLRSP